MSAAFKSGHQSHAPSCLLWANSGLLRRNRTAGNKVEGKALTDLSTRTSLRVFSSGTQSAEREVLLYFKKRLARRAIGLDSPRASYCYRPGLSSSGLLAPSRNSTVVKHRSLSPTFSRS